MIDKTPSLILPMSFAVILEYIGVLDMMNKERYKGSHLAA
jgi:hypothetical protein